MPTSIGTTKYIADSNAGPAAVTMSRAVATQAPATAKQHGTRGSGRSPADGFRTTMSGASRWTRGRQHVGTRSPASTNRWDPSHRNVEKANDFGGLGHAGITRPAPSNGHERGNKGSSAVHATPA